MKLLIAIFDAEIATPGPAASRPARASASSTTVPSGTTKFTRLIRSASAAVRRSPVIRKYLALLTPISSGQITCPPSPAPMPILTWVSANTADSGGVDDVAQQRDRRPEPHRVAVHRRDHRLRALQQVVDDLAALLQRHARVRRRWLRPEVAAGAERPPGAGDHEHPDGRVGVDVTGQPCELVVHLGVDRVEAVRAVQRGQHDAVVALVDRDRLVAGGIQHRSSSGQVARCAVSRYSCSSTSLPDGPTRPTTQARMSIGVPSGSVDTARCSSTNPSGKMARCTST